MRLMMTLGLMAAVLGGLGMIQPVRADGVDDYIKTEMAARHIPGLSVAVTENGKVVKTRGYGLADVAAKTPAGPETVYGLGSCTKPFTAVAVLQLAEAGKVSLDAPISRYLSGLPAAWGAITVRELLTHTSGLPNYRLGLDYAHLAQYDTPESVVALLKDAPLESAPGTKYAYSNTNYHLLGMIVEKASGQTYADYLAAHEFQPAGMTATRLADPQAAPPSGLATGYDWDGKARARTRHIFPQAINFGDSGLLSTVGDIVKWEDALGEGRLLPPARLKEMETPGRLADGTPVIYGLGWIVTSYEGHRLIAHSGAEPGYSSSIFRFPDDGLTVILLGNVFDGSPLTDTLAAGIANRFLPGLAPPPEPKTAALLCAVISDLAAGKADPARFTPPMYAVWTPAVLAQTRASLAPAGPLQSLTLVAKRDESGLHVFRYRAVFSNNVALFGFALTPDGKIAAFKFAGE